MTGLKILAIAVLGVAVAACESPAAKVEYDQSADFYRYRTYTWAAASQVPSTEDPRIGPLTEKRIQDAIDWELQAKGYRFSDSADFRVAYSATINEYEQPNSYGGMGWGGGTGIGIGGGGFGGGGGGVGIFVPLGGSNPVEYREAVIAVNIFDTARDEPVWHGHTSARLNSDTVPPAVVDQSVKKILSTFPPP